MSLFIHKKIPIKWGSIKCTEIAFNAHDDVA